jgi:2-oxo-3-hexenedioate decarboxylase
MARMSDLDRALAEELLAAAATGAMVSPPSSRISDFGMAAAYSVEAEMKGLRIASGRKATGLKVGYANKAMWRALKLETLVWAHMYDDTVHFAKEDLTLAHYRSPKIEPEIVFKLKQQIARGSILESVEWLSIGFEIIDCPFPDWQFKPADFVAAGGLHVALVVGEPLAFEPALTEKLAGFKVRLLKNGQMVEEGSARNCLRSPALCLEELARATSLSPGDLVSSGTLTTGQPVAKGDVWGVEIEDLPVSGLTLSFSRR